MNIYQSNTYRKDLSCLHFDNEPRVQKRQQVKYQQSCIFVFVAYQFQVVTRFTSTGMAAVFHMHDLMVDLKRYRTTSGERNFIDQIKAPIFLEVVLAIEKM